MPQDPCKPPSETPLGACSPGAAIMAMPPAEEPDMTDRTKQTQDRESPQVGTHGSSPEHDVTKTAEGDWTERPADAGHDQTDPLQREMARGGQTKEQHPDGLTPLERDQRPINQQR
jgi:hypothetical protein